jgi:hypothetical protein
VVEAAPRRGVCATARSPLRRSPLRWSQRAGGRVFLSASFGQRDLCGGSGSVRRQRRPSQCLLSSGSASVSAVFPSAQLEGPGGSTGVNRPAAATTSCSDDGDLRDHVLLEQGLRYVVGRSRLNLLLHWEETADLQSVEHGDAPRPTCPKVLAPAFNGGLQNRLTTLIQLWCFGGCWCVGGSSSFPPTVLRRRRWMTSNDVDVCKGLQRLECFFFLWGVFVQSSKDTCVSRSFWFVLRVCGPFVLGL